MFKIFQRSQQKNFKFKDETNLKPVGNQFMSREREDSVFQIYLDNKNRYLKI